MVVLDMGDNRRYHLDYDTYNIIVGNVRIGVDETLKNFGKEIISNKSFFSTPESVARKLIFFELGEAIERGVTELAPEIEKSIARLKSELNEHKEQ